MTEAATAFLTKLRLATAPLHKSIEQLSLSASLVAAEVTLQNYRDYLSALYGFVNKFELAIYPQVQHILDDLESRKKAALLLSDLQFLGVDPKEIQTLHKAFFGQCPSPSEALGCIYVMEGSILGGQFISKHLEKALGESVTGSLSYLKAYGQKTGPMWKKFLDTFCESAVSSGQQDEAIRGAVKTFELLKRWIAKENAALREA